MTFEFTDGVGRIFELYPDSVLANVCNPAHGLASKFEFFPSLAKLKSFCENAANEIYERELKIRLAATEKPAPPKNAPEANSGCYTGPIELIKPGDIISWERFDEYRAFMKTKKNMPVVKLWGTNETYKDSGQRPFQISVKPQEPITETQPNPFLP